MTGISCSTSVVRTVPCEEALARLAEAGFARVELGRSHGDALPAPSRVEALGLRVWAVHGSLAGGAASPDERARRAAVAAEAEAMRRAAPFAPCPYVVHYLNRANDPAVGVAYRRSIDELLRTAERERFVLAVETVPYKPEVNERYADSAEVAAFVRELAAPCAAVCVDLNHSNLHESLETAIANCAGLIANIHVSDNHGDREEHLPPGRGVINFAPAFAALQGAGYTGPLNLEVSGKTERAPAELVALRRWAEAFAR